MTQRSLRRPAHLRVRLGALLALAALSASCSSDNDDAGAASGGSGGRSGSSSSGSSGLGGSDSGTGVAGDHTTGVAGESVTGGVGGGDGASRYVLPGVRFDPDYNATTYVVVLDSLAAEQIDWDRAREFPGFADVWVHEGSMFVSQEDFTITKYSVDDSGELVEQERLGFANYGPTDFGFWRNVFVSSTKAYFLNGSSEYVVWNPESMEITGTIPLPELPQQGELTAFPGYSDRSALIRDGLLYQPMYWTDESYFKFAPESRILVVDVNEDEVVDTLDAPCPGLDFATADATGNLYFSSWVFAPTGAAVLSQPATCVVGLPASESSPSVVFDVPAVMDGHQGGAMRHLGGDSFLLSVLHDEHAPDDAMGDPQIIGNGNNWRFWTYDAASNEGEMVDSIDWNSGGAYLAEVEGRQLLLVPSSDYSKTTAYAIRDDGAFERAFESQGWSVRLFELD